MIFLYNQHAESLSTAWTTNKIIRTDEKPFGQLVLSKKPDVQPFTVYEDNSLMNCVTECIARRHCVGFSYSRVFLRCELHDSEKDIILVDSPDWVYSRIKSWPNVSI